MRDLITLPEEGPETYTNGSEFDSPKGDHAPGILFVATCLEGPFFDPQQPTMSCTPAVREEAPTGARDQIGIGPFSSPCSIEDSRILGAKLQLFSNLRPLCMAPGVDVVYSRVHTQYEESLLDCVAVRRSPLGGA